MKKLILSVCLLILTVSITFSQKKPSVVFNEYRAIPSDTTWHKPYRLINQQKYENAKEEFLLLQQQNISSKDYRNYLFLANEYTYWIYSHRKAAEAKKILLDAVNEARKHLSEGYIELLIAYYNLAIYESNLNDKIQWYKTFLESYSKETYPRFGFIINRDIGSRYYALGKYNQAWQHWDACQTDFELSPESLSDLYNVIGSNIASHDVELAIEYLLKSIALLDKSEGNIGNLIALNGNVGQFYLRNKDYENAIKYSKVANNLLVNNRDFTEFRLYNRHNRYSTIIESYTRLGEFDNASTYIEEMRRELPGFSNPRVSEGMLVWHESMIYRLDKQFEKAHQKLDEFYNIYIDIFKNPLSPYLVNYYFDKADIYQKTQKYNEAIANFENTLKAIAYNHYQSIDDKLKILPPESYHNLYIPYVRDILLSILESYRLMLEKDSDEALLKDMMQIVTYTNLVIKYHYSGIADERLAIEASSNLKKTSFYGIFASWKLSQTNRSYIDTAFVLSDSPRAFNLNFQRNIAQRYASDSAQIELRRISEITNQISNIQALGGEKDNLFDLKKELYRAKVNLSERYSATLEFMDNAANALGVKTSIDKSSAAIQYFAKGDTIFIVGINQKKSDIQLITSREFNSKIKGFSRDIKTGISQSGYQREFYDLLIKPIEPIIKGKQKLHVFADESLMEVPFELFSNPEGELLIKKHSIEYLYTSKGFSNTTSRSNWSLLAIAPTFGETEIISPTMLSQVTLNDKEVFRSVSNRTMLVPLPHSQSEVDEISNIFSANKIPFELVVGADATKEKFIEKMPQHTILHIASHGVSGDRHNSGLFFHASYNREINSHFLRMAELFNIKTNASLVVLSACKTGVGEVVEGEGIMALPRGFLYAGSQNVIASLWKVHDQKTKEFMVIFYKYLLKGNSYAESLRLTKLDCISKGFLPIDWAGFVLIKG